MQRRPSLPVLGRIGRAVSLPAGCIVDATIKAVIEHTGGLRLQVDFGRGESELRNGGRETSSRAGGTVSKDKAGCRIASRLGGFAPVTLEVIMVGDDKTAPGHYDGFKPGSEDSFGRTIRTIIGRHRHMVVYITSDGVVGWDYKELPERLRCAVTEFQILDGLANFCLSKKLRGVAANLLAKSLYAGLLCENSQNPLEKFEDVRRFVVERACGRARLYYVLWSVFFAFVFGLIILYYSQWEIPSVPFVGILGGLAGASISIIQRGWKLSVDPLCSVPHLAFQGLIRVLLGAIFGAVLVSASKANLLLGHISGEPWALFAYSVAAGFSERFVPDLLEHSLERVA